MNQAEIITTLLSQIGLNSVPVPMPKNETVCEVQASEIRNITQALLDAGWWHLTAVTALAEGESIILLYHFWLHGGLTLRVRLSADQPRIASITPIIPGAAFYEREIQELFSVEFSGLSIKKPLFLSDDWSEAAPMKPPTGQTENSAGMDRNSEEKK